MDTIQDGVVVIMHYTLKNDQGETERIVLARPPSFRPSDEDSINPLLRESNRDQGIYTRIIYCPAPFRDDA